MKNIIIITGNFLIICLTICSCVTDTKERTKLANGESIKSINENEQKVELIWLNETQGYFVDNRDGRKYKIIKIGTQIWMAENLAYKPVRGDFWAYENNRKNIGKFGYLYFWETARKACPTGWHLPDNKEWNTLIDFLGGKDVAGGKLKSTIGWTIPNKGATNSSGFSALPDGNRAVGGSFYHLGNDALFWSATTKSSRSAWKIRLNYTWDSVGREPCGRLTGLSVRCIKN